MDTQHCCQQSASVRVLFEQVSADELDAAIENGLMGFVDCAACRASDPDYAAMADALTAVRGRLAQAWAARDRYRARNARLARRAAEREARRTAVDVEKRSPLPAAAAAILARAKAKAAERDAK
jgi:Na+-translocating ferredoxin:NAD+ oxidoreductase RnfC subunit